MHDLQLLVDLHKGALRQGPGGDDETSRALSLAGIDRTQPLEIADIGCGTGASALVLARQLNAHITAVDFLQDFLDELTVRAERAGLADKITGVCASMESLPFEREQFDVIWSEGAIYNVGFTTGLKDWRPYLKPGGILVVSEITWTTDNRPLEIQQHWDSVYPEIATAAVKQEQLANSGYSMLGYFSLPQHCWLENYYDPMRAQFAELLSANDGSDAARAIVEAERHEIALYERYSDYFSYGVYIGRKTDAN